MAEHDWTAKSCKISSNLIASNSSTQTTPVPQQPRRTHAGWRSILIYRQEGGGRAPMLTLWNATRSSPLPLQLFSFSPRPLPMTIEDSESENFEIGPNRSHHPSSMTNYINGSSYIQGWRNQQDSQMQETRFNTGFPSPHSSPGTSPVENNKRKRSDDNLPPYKHSNIQDQYHYQHPIPQPNGHPSTSSLQRVPYYRPLSPLSISSHDPQRNFPIDLPIGLHEDPWYYVSNVHRSAQQVLRDRLKLRIMPTRISQQQAPPSMYGVSPTV